MDRKGNKNLDTDLFNYMDNYYEFDSEDDLDLENELDLDDGNIDAMTFNSWLKSLEDMCSRDRVDAAAESFCLNFNTHANRKKLITLLGVIAKAKMDLIPFNCRLVATLMPLMPHVGEELIAVVLSTFRFFMRKKETVMITSKLKCVKYIAELTKFGLIDRSITLGCLNVLITDFSSYAQRFDQNRFFWKIRPRYRSSQ